MRTCSFGTRQVEGVAGTQSAWGIEHPQSCTAKVGGRYRKQSKVISYHTPEARPGSLRLLGIDHAAALLDGEGACELRNAPCRSDESPLLA